MQCDVQLWKQLIELYASISTLKDYFREKALIRESLTSLSSASSDTESFVSAEEYSEVCSLNVADDRVISWINQCNSGEKVTAENFEEVDDTFSYRPRSRTCDDLFSGDTDWQGGIELSFLKTYFSTAQLNNLYIDYNLLHGDISASVLARIPRPFGNMKSLEDIKIVSGTNFSYYKSSLRLLGSVRMRSRIFEPSLTKWRPFSVTEPSENYIIIPPRTFSNIQPRPKLRRLFDVFDKETAHAVVENYEHNNYYVKDLGGTECLIKTGSRTHSDNKEKTRTLNTPVSTGSEEKSENVEQFYGALNDSHETDDEDQKCPVNTREVQEYSEKFWNKKLQLSDERGDVEQVKSAWSGSRDQTESNIDSEDASYTEIVFHHDFLEVKDGFITCRINSSHQNAVEPDDFEYLVIVDGRVTFTPHISDGDNEESYYLGWLFENNESENDEESYYIHLLFNEIETANTKSNHNKESSCMQSSTVTEEAKVGCEENLGIHHLLESNMTKHLNEEFSDSYNIKDLFDRLSTDIDGKEVCADILTDN